METLKLHQIIEMSECLEEINYINIYHKKKQLKAYFGQPVYFIATFVSNAVQCGLIASEQHLSEIIHEVASLHSDSNEVYEELIELYSFRTYLL